jgi:hypothetical protein
MYLYSANYQLGIKKSKEALFIVFEVEDLFSVGKA